MTFIEVVRKRQSVRRFLSKAVPREIIDRCIEAARLAPSACNSQPWTFVVVDEEKAKDRLAEKAFSGIYSMNAFVRKAPVIIAVVTERSKYMARFGGQFRGVQYSLIDIGIACEHFILQATEDGVGTCWLGWFNEKAVKNILKLPRKAKIDVLIGMGYPESDAIREKQRKSLDEIRAYFNPNTD